MFSVVVGYFHGNPSTSDSNTVVLVVDVETPRRQDPQTSTMPSPLPNFPNISNISAPEGSSGVL